MSTLLSCPQGEFKLEITPKTQNKSLRAWDAADEYALHHLAELEALDMSNVIIVNDSFGALTNALISTKPTHISDSYLARQAAIHNLNANHKTAQDVTWLNSLENPANPISLLLLKIPKSLALLEDQLIRLRPQMTADTAIIAAGMTRGIHTSTLKLFEKIIGPTHTSLAKKKARLIHVKLDIQLPTQQSPWPCRYEIPDLSLTISSHANVFSSTKPDIGSMYMLDAIPTSNDAQTIIDLACGNGTLGIVAAMRNPQAKLIFTDESCMAIESAKLNFSSLFSARRDAEFLLGDCLNELNSDGVDLILNNPPFHMQNIITDEIAWKMFKQSHANLKKGGRLIVVGNRHLDYHNKLKRLFSTTKLLKSNRKFVVFQSVKH